jgi:hypothetical protein
MILPGTYANGFAPRDGIPLFPELWRGCVGAWNPGLGPTGLTLRDWSAYKNHGTLTNMDPGTDWVASEGRYALDFDGSNDYVTMGSPSILRINSSVTVSAWVLPRLTSQLGIAVHGSGAQVYFGLIFSAVSNQKLSFWNSGSAAITAPNTTPLNEWVHFAGARSSVGVELFINGQSVATAAGSSGNGSASLEMVLGRFGSFGGYTSSSQIAEVSIHNRALSPNEIRLLASRRGIAYEMAPRSWTASQIAAYRARYYSQVIGSGVV